MAAFVLHAIKLQKEQDMNMKSFVRDYLIFWGVARCLRMMLAFAIEQRGREVTIFHTFLFALLQFINLAVISYFFIEAMSMNENLPNKDESTPSGKVIVLAVAPFYIIAVSNFVEFLVRWFILFWFVFVILEDYTESVEKDRTSILEMLMPGTKTKAFD
jgi:large-conductance mechanosensitive channel